MPLVEEKNVLAAKIETTPGTAETLAAADAALNVWNKRVNDQTEFNERDGQVSFDPLPGALGPRLGQVVFETDLIPGTGGVLPSWATTFLPACGYVQSANVYTPRTEAPGANVKTLTIGHYTDGVRELLRGCAGTFRIEFVAGQVPRISWTFTGIYDEPQDIALVAPTYPTTNPIRFVSSALAVGSYTPKVQRLTFDAGGVVSVLPDSRGDSGFSHGLVGRRRQTITIDPETALVASADYWGDFTDRTLRAITWTMAEGGVGFSWSAPKAQLIQGPQGGNRGGARIEELTYQLTRNASLGDDSFAWTFDNT